MLRSSGVVLPVSALPGPFGIGCMGKEALDFARTILAAGFSYWQILPLGPTGSGDSPYQSFSTYAGNPYLIDLRPLCEAGWLTDAELQTATRDHMEIIDGVPYSRVDYGWLWETRRALLKTAASRLNEAERADVSRFSDSQDWLPDYAAFMTIKGRQGHRPWWEWPEALKLKDPSAVQKFIQPFTDEYFFHCFVQYIFRTQWFALKAAVNELGIKIIGDIPIYVASDSVDVWADRRWFELDDEGHQLRSAGVPPDLYTDDGQFWGNPLYRWDRLKADGYTWWLKRIKAAVDLCDIVRLDHFRGFEAYWAVEQGATLARAGVWEKGPAMDLFDPILRAFPLAPFIAEDLGYMTKEAENFVRQTGLPGMKVLQFHFSTDSDGELRPHDFEKKVCAYASTHDSDTLFGWLESLDTPTWELVRDYAGIRQHDRHLGGPKSRICRSVFRVLWQTPAQLVMVQMQDLLGQGNDMRTNRPGIADGNWRIRFTPEDLEQIDVAYFRRLNDVFQRTPAI